MIALITGATAGIGRATALKLAEAGYELILTGRRKERLEELQDTIALKFGRRALILCFDIRDRAETERCLGNLPIAWKNVEVLINNAGLAAGLAPFHEGNVDDWEQMIDTNVKGVLYATRCISPGMVERNKGHIINISSTAGKEVYPNGNVYCASKFAVDALNKSMRIDLVNYGIKVTSINPGMLESEFSLVRFKGDEERANKVYEGFAALQPEDVAEAIQFVLSRPTHVCIDELHIKPTAQASSRDLKRG